MQKYYLLEIFIMKSLFKRTQKLLSALVVAVSVFLVASISISAYNMRFRYRASLAANQKVATTQQYGDWVGQAKGYNNSGSAGDVVIEIQNSTGDGWGVLQQVTLEPGGRGETSIWGAANTQQLWRGNVYVPKAPWFGNPGRIASVSVYTD